MGALTVRRFVKGFAKHKGQLLQVTDFGKPVGTWVPVGQSRASLRAAAVERLFRLADRARPRPLDADGIRAEVVRRRGER